MKTLIMSINILSKILRVCESPSNIFFAALLVGFMTQMCTLQKDPLNISFKQKLKTTDVRFESKQAQKIKS